MIKKYKNLISILTLWLSTFWVGVLSYLYHPIMIRYLDLKQFAEFESLIGIINLLSVIITSISLFFVKELTKSNSNKKNIVIINIVKKIWIYFWIISFIIYCLISPFISNFLKIDNYFIIIFTGLILFFSFFSLYQWVFLQANKYFTFISIFWILNPIFRIIFGLLFVFLGFKVLWAIWWFIFSIFLLIIIRWLFINKKIGNYSKKNIKIIEKDIIKNLKLQKKQLFHFLFSSIILAFLMNIDILFAKHFFWVEKAWVYAWISIIAKFLVFIGMSIETVYYPILSAEDLINKKKIFIISVLYLFLIFAALWFFYFFGDLVLHIFKPWFEKYLNLLYLITIYCGLLSLLNFFVKIFIAFNKYLINYILSTLIIIFIILLYVFVNNSMYNLINIFNIFMIISLLIWFLYLWLTKNEK